MGNALQMVNIDFNTNEFFYWMGRRCLQDNDHAMHCLLTECFGDIAPKPFRLLLPDNGVKGYVYGYTHTTADDLKEAIETFAEPTQSSILSIDSIKGKTMPEQWRVGRKLGFEVRIRPVVRLQKDVSKIPDDVQRSFDKGGLRPGKECDAFIYEVIKSGCKKHRREDVYIDWLDKQFDRMGGAVLDKRGTSMIQCNRGKAYRKKYTRHTEGIDAVMRGALTVSDSYAFNEMLSRGIGRHRSYGYGMMQLKPVIA